MFSIKRTLLIPSLLLVAFPAGIVWAYVNGFFNERVFYQTGANPLDLALADINNDGLIDVLTANREGHSISIFMGNGDGSFTDVNPLNLDKSATSLAVSDFNHDNNPDLVVTSCGAYCENNEIILFAGAGDGSFIEVNKQKVSGVPYNIAVADFDLDGDIDCAASDYPNNRIIVLRNEKDFGPFTEEFYASAEHPIALQLADLNSDGYIDLLSSDHAAGGSSAILNDTKAGFNSATKIETGALPYAIALGDLNKDGHTDLVVAHSTDPGKISIYHGQESLGFVYKDQLNLEDRLIFVETADINQDGNLDIIATRAKQKFASIFLNKGDGTFNSEEFKFPAENEIYSLAIADLNQDGLPDLVTVDFGQHVMSVGLGQKISN